MPQVWDAALRMAEGFFPWKAVSPALKTPVPNDSPLGTYFMTLPSKNLQVQNSVPCLDSLLFVFCLKKKWWLVIFIDRLESIQAMPGKASSAGWGWNSVDFQQGNLSGVRQGCSCPPHFPNGLFFSHL